jgi:translation elongation factor aEF-1 beta
MEFNVIAEFKLYVEDGSKVDAVKAAVEKLVTAKQLKVNHFKVEDVAFGVKAVRAYIMFNDDAGGMDATEEELGKIEGVSQVQMEDVSRI